MRLYSKNHIENPSKSKIITDGCVAYNKFARENGLQIRRLKKVIENRNWKINKIPVVKGLYHIQNVNNFHGQINNLINCTFKGVGTKYLLQYINYVKWLRINKLDNNLLLNTCLNTSIKIMNHTIKNKSILKL